MKQQVLDLIRANPNIRTVEISDKLDIDVERVRPLIAAEISALIIVEELITAPNGRPVQSFRYRDAQPKVEPVAEPPAEPLPARVVRALPPAVRKTIAPTAPAVGQEPAREAPPVAAVAAFSPAQPEQAQEIDVPVTRKENAPLRRAVVKADGPTRVEMGMECLRANNGPVSSAMLSVAMGLPRGHYPISYLRGALNRKEVVRVGDNWALAGREEKAPAAVVLPDPVVTVREPAAEKPEFPRADPAALAAYVPGSKRCTMTCDAHADDPRCAAERALLCDDCETVARVEAVRAEPAQSAPGVEQIIAESERAMDDLRAAACKTCGGLPCGCATQPEQAAVQVPELAPAPAAPAIPDPAAQRFIAGVLSDGSLHLRIPGQQPLDLPPEHARALYQFMQAHGYAAWPTQVA